MRAEDRTRTARGARGGPLACAVVLVAALLGPPPAAAQESASQRIEDSDRDGDGRLTRQEAPVELLAIFSDIDADGDGRIDSFELWEYERKRTDAGPSEPAPRTQPSPRSAREGGAGASSLEDLVRRRDRNGDGRLELSEAPLSFHETLFRLDRDGDHALSLEEARAIDAGRQAGRGGGRTLVWVVGRMDTDGDGKLQRKEAPLRLQAVFERFDRNGDGAIDLDEAAAADDAVAKEGDGRR